MSRGDNSHGDGEDAPRVRAFSGLHGRRPVILINELIRPVETDAKVRAVDWEVVRRQSRQTGRNIDGRDGVFRVWSVCWFDDVLCRRAFGIDAQEAVRRVAPECERAELVAGCAFLIATSATVVGPNLDVTDACIRARLGGSEVAQRGTA